ncbi:replicative DNA helicase [Desulfurobacterium atlanticum]|uniref:Replicative DNA helicase n=1 Tax=Desulfurobacterium atlanticum TaxID=240169 RepID=A0A238YP46_9BACT|nr:replicative DNA helicase [Desulfurobacterium atlanticum]SNR72363.1 replicative DNA helicase [Desulfurobacterium atlanticum]
MKFFDIEAELSVLGTVIVQPAFAFRAVELLEPDDFFKNEHKVFFKFLRLLIAEGYSETDLNEISYKDELEKRGLLEKIGGEEYLAHMVEFALDNYEKFESACKVVKDKAILRRIDEIVEDVKEKMEETPDPDVLIDYMEKRVFAVSEERLTNSLVPISEIIPEVVKEMEELAVRKSMVTGIPTGFTDLDQKTSGLHDSDLIIIAARPSMGKTAFALSLAYNIAVERGKSVAIFSLEMSKDQLVKRLAAQAAGVPLNKIRSGFLSPADLDKILEAYDSLKEAPIYIDDTPGISVLDLRAKARRLQSENGLDLVIIDYLQLMRGIKKTENRQQEVSEISRSLKALAKELNIPVIALSQLSRQVEHRSDKRPQLADLRESGSIEQDADIVMFIHRPEVYKKEPPPEERGIAEIIIAKQRNGPTGTVTLSFIKELTRFENLQEIPMVNDKDREEPFKEEAPIIMEMEDKESSSPPDFTFDEGDDDYDFEF